MRYRTVKTVMELLYATRYMLDEVGNLQSEGKGIPNLPTLLSIGLGQSQQFSATCCIVKSYTVILQTVISMFYTINYDMHFVCMKLVEVGRS